MKQCDTQTLVRMEDCFFTTTNIIAGPQTATLPPTPSQHAFLSAITFGTAVSLP